MQIKRKDRIKAFLRIHFLARKILAAIYGSNFGAQTRSNWKQTVWRQK